MRAQDYAVDEARNSLEAVRRVYALRPDAVVIDAGLSGIAATGLTAILRAASDSLAILVLGQAQGALEVGEVLEAGADDYLPHPQTDEEFAARLRATARRAAGRRSLDHDAKVIRTGEITINRELRVVTCAGRRVSLTPTEYRMIEVLAMRIGRLVTHRELLSAVWGESCLSATHYLRVYIGYLRRKLEVRPGQPQYLLNERGAGYRLALLTPSLSS